MSGMYFHLNMVNVLCVPVVLWSMFLAEIGTGSIRMGKKCDLSDFDCGARQVSLSISESTGISTHDHL